MTKRMPLTKCSKIDKKYIQVTLHKSQDKVTIQCRGFFVGRGSHGGQQRTLSTLASQLLRSVFLGTNEKSADIRGLEMT
jgi:hypothetical protein